MGKLARYFDRVVVISFASIAALLLAFFLSSCVKPYVGLRVNTYSSMWCRYDDTAQTCRTNDGYFVFEFSINEGQNEGEYVIEGTLDAREGKAKSWKSLHKSSNFAFVLANEGVVTDYISFIPRGTDLAARLPFKKSFETQPFDAVAITWKASISG